MKEDQHTHYLGQEFRDGARNRFYLLILEDGGYSLLLEKDGSPRPWKLQPNEFQGHFVNEIPLAMVVAKKFAELDIKPR